MMPARQFSSAAELMDDVRQVRGRLRPPAEVVRVRVDRAPIAADADPAEIERKRKPRDFLFVYRTPYKNSGARWQHSSADAIIAEVCAKHRVSGAEIKGKTRNKAVVAARFEAYFFLQQQLGYSLAMIGRAMGGKDHTGVIHGIRRHKERMEAGGL